MGIYDAFLSYVHQNDAAEKARILAIGDDIRKEYKLVTNQELNLFSDRDSLKLGGEWAVEIENGLKSAVVFIPILSEGYFASQYCRHELETFVQNAINLGINNLIIPILYTDVDGFLEGTSTDQLVVLASKYQGVDWRELRFEDRTSSAYRKEIAKIVQRIIKALKEAKVLIQSGHPKNGPVPQASADDEPGMLDLLALHEQRIHEAPITLNLITEQQKIITEIQKETTEEVKIINTQPMSSSAKLLSARRLAGRLAEPAEKILELANQLSQQLHDADGGYRIILTRLPEEVLKNPEGKAAFCKLAASVRQLVEAGHDQVEKAEILFNVYEGTAKISRELRPVIRRLQQGLTTMIDLKSLYDDWLALIEASGIDCE